MMSTTYHFQKVRNLQVGPISGVHDRHPGLGLAVGTPVLLTSGPRRYGTVNYMRMTIRLIALDIDGTLLDGRSQLPDINRQAIVDASARGIEIALVTGRRYDFAMPVAR